MKKKKRKLIIKKNILLITSIIVLIITGVLLFIYSRTIKGDEVAKGIYQYQIKGKEETYIPMEIENDDIYYLMQDDLIYTLYRYNIHSKKPKRIGTIKKEYDYCAFEKGYINCVDNDYDNDDGFESRQIEDVYYDYKLNLVFKKPIDNKEQVDVLLYNGKFATLKGKKIYDENNNVIKELKFDLPNASLFGEYTIDGNIYLVFYSMNDRDYLYYDVTNDTYEKKDDLLYSRYDRGFYALSNGNVTTYDLPEKKITEYTELNLGNYARTSTIYKNVFYFFENNQLYALDLNKKTIDRFEYKFEKDISGIDFYGDYIYLYSYAVDCTIYLLDTKETNKTSYASIEEYTKYMDDLIDKKVLELEDKFHIDIVYKDQVKIKNGTFKTTVMNNNYIIVTTLDILEEILNKFNVEFFDKFREKGNKGIVIYLSGQIIPMEGADTTSYPSGYTLTKDDEYGAVVDANGWGLKSTLCHELMHNIEFKMNSNIYDKWFKINPKKFEYQYTYKIDASSKYTISEEDKNNVYFFDYYAKSYPTEDIARIFENICDHEENSVLLEYPHLLEKANLLKETMEKYFPSLKETTVFNSLKKTEKKATE